MNLLLVKTHNAKPRWWLMGGGHTTGRPPKMQSQGGGLWEVVTPKGYHPKCKAKVVANGRWSHHRDTTQNAKSKWWLMGGGHTIGQPPKMQSQGGGWWEVVTPQGNHPKCKVKVVDYRRWSHHRETTQNAKPRWTLVVLQHMIQFTSVETLKYGLGWVTSLTIQVENNWKIQFTSIESGCGHLQKVVA